MKRHWYIAILLAALLGGCKRPPDTIREVKLQSVERVLMHEPNDYTLLVRNGEKELLLKEIVLDPHYKEGGSRIPRIVTDVPPERKMWALVKYRKTYLSSSQIEYAYYLELHLHSAEDMNGAGWEKRVGKNSTRQGTTQVVE